MNESRSGSSRQTDSTDRQIQQTDNNRFSRESEGTRKKTNLFNVLTGGPGFWSYLAIFYQIGPLTINYTNSTLEKAILEINPYSWTKWLVDHPKFINSPLYVGGDSYSGIVLPMIVQEIYNGNEAGEGTCINIKGYVL
ncbi:serine carboxypeptidase-like protein 13, partial [Tanacetum coccineum]